MYLPITNRLNTGGVQIKIRMYFSGAFQGRREKERKRRENERDKSIE